jgi:hypothetical protein
MINVRFLSALNIAYSDAELLDLIESLAVELEHGTLSANIDGDEITSLSLTEAGRRLLPSVMSAVAE